MTIRIAQTLLVMLLGIYSSMAFLNNVLDPQANLIFVEKILTMEDTFPDNPLHWRGIENRVIQKVGFGLIILTEFLTSALCLFGSYLMFRNRKEPKEVFFYSKKWSVLGIMIGILLWFGGFVIIGGEWFLSWQSENFDGVELGMRNGIFYLGVLIFVSVGSS